MSSHIVNIGQMVEKMENSIRSTLDTIYFGRTRDIMNETRSLVEWVYHLKLLIFSCYTPWHEGFGRVRREVYQQSTPASPWSACIGGSEFKLDQHLSRKVLDSAFDITFNKISSWIALYNVLRVFYLACFCHQVQKTASVSNIWFDLRRELFRFLKYFPFSSLKGKEKMDKVNRQLATALAEKNKKSAQ